jgi:hypothetical protein
LSKSFRNLQCALWQDGCLGLQLELQASFPEEMKRPILVDPLLYVRSCVGLPRCLRSCCDLREPQSTGGPDTHQGRRREQRLGLTLDRQVWLVRVCTTQHSHELQQRRKPLPHCLGQRSGQWHKFWAVLGLHSYGTLQTGKGKRAS